MAPAPPGAFQEVAHRCRQCCERRLELVGDGRQQRRLERVCLAQGVCLRGGVEEALALKERRDEVGGGLHEARLGRRDRLAVRDGLDAQ